MYDGAGMVGSGRAMEDAAVAKAQSMLGANQAKSNSMQPKEPGLCGVVTLLVDRVGSLHSAIGGIDVAYTRVLGTLPSGLLGEKSDEDRHVKMPESIDGQLRLILLSLAALEGRIHTLVHHFNEKL